MKDNQESIFPQDFPTPPDEIDKDKLEKRILAKELKEWRIVESPLPEDPFIPRKELFREFKFKDFDKVLEFMNKVGVACNIFPHHPRWENTWATLKVWLSTWDSNHIISYKDVMLARYMDKIFEEYEVIEEESHSEKRIKEEQNSFVQKMKELIAKDELEEAFERISIYINVNSEKRYTNDLIIQRQKYQRNRKEKRDNLRPTEELNRELSQIIHSLLEILSEINKAP